MGGAVQALESGQCTEQVSPNSGPSSPPPVSVPREAGQLWAGARGAREGPFPPGSKQDPEQAVAVSRSHGGASAPTPVGPSVIRAIFRTLFLPISGLWTGPESGPSRAKDWSR